ncbi:nitroreductase family protein [Nocardioides sp. W7]|uniref:nitroreductase family protein n=1 Tax=Nocardioides sp. W7 TaxID=2931390 RepID=UPI001FD14FC3|nr:nitroreductase family protein [Nocardioides sp. W7]
MPSSRPSAARVVELACRAPSVHNTQPWCWRIDGDRVELHADRSRQLVVADAGGRNLLISCGAALHHAIVAAAGLGYDARVVRHPDPEQPDLLAHLDLVPAPRTAAATDRLRTLLARRTDRRRFTAWPVTEEQLGELAHGIRDGGVQVVPVAGIADRLRVELLAARARAAEAADDRYAEEQSRWADEARSDAVERPDGVLLLCTTTDGPESWLAAGEALSELWLRATQEGLSVVPLSQLLEVEETRSALHHEVLGGLVVPQLLLRLGWQEIGLSDLPATPRRPLAEVLAGPDGQGTKVPARGAVRPVR